MSNDRLWVLGSLVLTGVILVAGWFLGVSPNLAQLAENKTALLDAEQINKQQVLELRSLEERFAELPDLEAELAAEQKVVPATAELPAFVERLNSLESTGAHVTDVTLSEAIFYEPGVVVEEVVPTEEAAPTAEGDGTTDADTAATTGSTPTAPTEVPAAIEGANLLGSANFWLIPVTIKVNGDFDQIMSYLDELQAGERLFVPYKLTVDFDDDKDRYNNEFEGYLYVLGDEAAGQDIVDPVEGETAGVTVG